MASTIDDRGHFDTGLGYGQSRSGVTVSSQCRTSDKTVYSDPTSNGLYPRFGGNGSKPEEEQRGQLPLLFLKRMLFVLRLTCALFIVLT